MRPKTKKVAEPLRFLSFVKKETRVREILLRLDKFAQKNYNERLIHRLDLLTDAALVAFNRGNQEGFKLLTGAVMTTVRQVWPWEFRDRFPKDECDKIWSSVANLYYRKSRCDPLQVGWVLGQAKAAIRLLQSSSSSLSKMRQKNMHQLSAAVLNASLWGEWPWPKEAEEGHRELLARSARRIERITKLEEAGRI